MDATQQNIDNREANYDFLRIICTLAILVIHVSGTYKDAISDPNVFEGLYKSHILTIVVYNTLSRFAVPCFMMLSGAFLLANPKNRDYRQFYCKSFISIGIPTLIFTILYFLYNEGLYCAMVIFKNKPIDIILTPIKELFVGAPFYHMWYLYTLIGVYLVIPLLIRLKDDIGEKSFAKMSWIFFFIATISGFTSNFKIMWSYSKTICYIGFVLAGYQIRRNSVEKKNNMRALLLILMGIVVESILTYIQYGHSLKGISETQEVYSLIGNFNPLVVIASVMLFWGFSLMKCSSALWSKFAEKTFAIYLVHAGIWDVAKRVLGAIFKDGSDCRVIIPLSVLGLLISSYFLAIIYNSIWAKIDNNKVLTKKIMDKYAK